MVTYDSKKWIFAILFVVLGMVVGAGMASVISAQGDEITACVHRNGNVRIVDSPSDCRNQEEVVQWNIQGGGGSQGPQGPAGPAGISGYQVVRLDFALPAGGFLRNSAVCPAGKVVLGGGAQVVGENSADFGTVLRESAPMTVGGGNQSGWLAAVRNNGNVAHTIGIFAVCATISP